VAELSAADQNDLPDDAFAHIEKGGTKDASGKTVPRSLRHFPIHDAAHVRNALARAPQSPFGDAAMPKIKAAAAKFGVQAGDDGGRSMERVPVERRYTRSPVECRAVADGKRITGYAAVFHTPANPVMSRNLGGFVERVMPSAFNQARQAGFPGMVCRYNHDGNMLLGTITGRTLDLDVDNVGLRYDVLPPQARADILELVGRGDVQHSSFAFRCTAGGDEWAMTEQNYPMRSLIDVQGVDVAPVVDPAYPDATAGLRSLAEHMGADLAEVRKMADADELRRFFVRTDIDGGAPRKPAKPKMLGAAAAAALLERRFDPYVDEG
jgi:HK97 family phage prohead protease